MTFQAAVIANGDARFDVAAHRPDRCVFIPKEESPAHASPSTHVEKCSAVCGKLAGPRWLWRKMRSFTEGGTADSVRTGHRSSVSTTNQSGKTPQHGAVSGHEGGQFLRLGDLGMDAKGFEPATIAHLSRYAVNLLALTASSHAIRD